MPRLDTTLNQTEVWQEMLHNARRRIRVDIGEVERVINLALRTPEFCGYEDELQQLSVFFETATQFHQMENPDELAALVGFWERYREVVIQRYAAITPVELRAADKVVKDIFQRFLKGVPNQNIAYSPDATPLVYGGEGGLGAYFTNPPGWNRPFAIINLPHTAFDNVWQWLALPHETGHDTYATIAGLAEELGNALEARMREAVQNGEVDIPDVDFDLSPFGASHRIQYTGEDFLVTLWRAWTNEAQADIVGLLNCGGSAAVALQQIIGFSPNDAWDIFRTDESFGDRPEEHPTSYVRNAFNIAALRLMGEGHERLAVEIETRFQSQRPETQNITWFFAEEFEFASVPVHDMATSAAIAAEVIVSANFQALGNKSYQDLGDFTEGDQAIVDDMTSLLVAGNPTFAQIENSTPRHALAATIFAFENDRSKAVSINRTFKHFV
jgi:hypothetical protein